MNATIPRQLMAGACVATLFVNVAFASDAGQLTKDKADKVFPRSRPTRPTPDATSRRGRSSATRTCTPRSRWTPAPSARGSAPRDAYRFARGEEVTASTPASRSKLSRPLDFLVVADHSDGMGFFPQLFGGDPELLADPTGPEVVRHDPAAARAPRRRSTSSSAFGRASCPKGFPTPGHDGLPRRLAGDHQGGRGVQRPGPLHRLHRLRVDLEHRRQQPAPQRHLPRRRRARRAWSSRSRRCRRSAATTRVDLWKWMAAYEEKTGGEVLAIAAQRQPEQRPRCSRWSRRSASRSTASTPRRAPAGSRSTR